MKYTDLPKQLQPHTRTESKTKATHVKSMLTSTIHTPFPKLSVIFKLTVFCCLSLCLATIVRARSATNTIVDMIAVAMESTREMIHGARWKTQHDAMTGRTVRKASPAAMGCSMSRIVSALRISFASSGSFVTPAMNVGSIV